MTGAVSARRLYVLPALGTLRARRRGNEMRDYSLFIEDDRYTVPTLVIVTVASDERANEIALDHLNRSDHHLSVEVRTLAGIVSNIRRPQSS